MNPDWRELMETLKRHDVQFLVVGAHAVAVHGVPRSTQDLDIWLARSAENAARVWRALADFGAPLPAIGVTQADFEDADCVVQLGVPPVRVDLMTDISGVDSFAAAFENRVDATVEGVTVPVLGRRELIANKRASGRGKDRVDLEWLEQG
ncbi:MAG: nucleotidyltransferase [Gemmatimonadaceae bacterium]|nr:nucleotidyltransferase [Gemmatimonadaceae bacterium]